MNKILKEKRELFIRSVSEGTIKGLLDELLEKRVLNQEEMQKVQSLIDSVIRKGALSCQICITYICEEDSHLAGTLGLSEAVQDNPAMPTSSSPEGSSKLCSLDAQRIWKEKSQRCHAQNTMIKGGSSEIQGLFLRANFIERFWRITLLLPLNKGLLFPRIQGLYTELQIGTHKLS
uniref:CARD domain-containing protein n=1 Tax=Saimiri boliviensis boliviensis TaxID=39432 RepID=A0A2K6TVS3_SAIBB